MSKQATFSASITLTSSDEPEGGQIDLGPFVSNVNGTAGANTTSPGISNVVGLTVSNVSSLTTIASGPYFQPNVTAMYFALLPVAETAGTITLTSANAGDVGLQVSSTNPSFIPILPAGDTSQTARLTASTSTFVRIGWF